MAKPIICDKCGEIVPQDEIVEQPFYADCESLGAITSSFGLRIHFLKAAPGASKVSTDICKKCSFELIVMAGDSAKRILPLYEKDNSKKAKKEGVR